MRLWEGEWVLSNHSHHLKTALSIIRIIHYTLGATIGAYPTQSISFQAPLKSQPCDKGSALRLTSLFKLEFTRWNYKDLQLILGVQCVSS